MVRTKVWCISIVWKVGGEIELSIQLNPILARSRYTVNKTCKQAGKGRAKVFLRWEVLVSDSGENEGL